MKTARKDSIEMNELHFVHFQSATVDFGAFWTGLSNLVSDMRPPIQK